MRKWIFIAPVIIASPAAAHDAGSAYHLHPHGMDFGLLGVVAITVMAVAVRGWCLRQRSNMTAND